MAGTKRVVTIRQGQVEGHVTCTGDINLADVLEQALGFGDVRIQNVIVQSNGLYVMYNLGKTVSPFYCSVTIETLVE